MDEPEPELRQLVDQVDQIPNTEIVLRVIQPGFQNGDTFQSNGFQDQRLEVAQSYGLAEPCASVVVKSIWEANEATVDDLLRGHEPGSRLAQLRVADLRNLKSGDGTAVPIGLMLDPRDKAPWHAVMFGMGKRPRTPGTNRAVSKVASWFSPPDSGGAVDENASDPVESDGSS